MEDKRWRQVLKQWDNLTVEKKHRVAHKYEEAIAKKIGTPIGTTTYSASDAKEFIEQATAARRPWLLIDIPESRPGSEIALYCVLESQGRRLRKDDHVVGELQRSAVWDRYARDLRDAAGKIRIFCDPKLVDIVDATISAEIGVEELCSVIEGV